MTGTYFEVSGQIKCPCFVACVVLSSNDVLIFNLKCTFSTFMVNSKLSLRFKKLLSSYPQADCVETAVATLSLDSKDLSICFASE